jgi:hypothetical protein
MLPRSVDRKAGADRRGHRLFDDLDAARARELRGVAHGALFDARDFGRHADDDRRFRMEQRIEERAVLRHLFDEVVEHRFGHFEVGDDAVAQRPDGLNVARRAPEHLPRLFADGERAFVRTSFATTDGSRNTMPFPLT